MDPIRSKLAELIQAAARKGMEHLDPSSDVARALKGADIEAILHDDIRRICEALSFFEITRASFLAARIPMVKSGERGPLKEELKAIAEKAAAKAEAKGGKLRVPDCCRELLFDL